MACTIWPTCCMSVGLGIAWDFMLVTQVWYLSLGTETIWYVTTCLSTPCPHKQRSESSTLEEQRRQSSVSAQDVFRQSPQVTWVLAALRAENTNTTVTLKVRKIDLKCRKECLGHGCEHEVGVKLPILCLCRPLYWLKQKRICVDKILLRGICFSTKTFLSLNKRNQTQESRIKCLNTSSHAITLPKENTPKNVEDYDLNQ